MAIISESYEMGDRFIWCNDDMGMHSISHTIYCELYSQPSLILSEFEVILDIVVLHARGRSLTLLRLRGSREANATSTLILEAFTQLPIILTNERGIFPNCRPHLSDLYRWHVLVSKRGLHSQRSPCGLFLTMAGATGQGTSMLKTEKEISLVC